MPNVTTKSWGKSELYEGLALMMIGTCVWFIGVKFGVFESVIWYAVENHLMNEPLAKPLFPGIKTELDAVRIRIGARTSLNFASAS